MKNRSILLTSILLIIALGNYTRIIDNENIRSVEFLSILAIGILVGILLTQIFSIFFKK